MAQEITSARSRRDFLKLSSSLLIGTTLRPFSALSSTPRPLNLIERTAFTMGSIVTIKAYCSDEELCNKAIDEAFREMKTIDKLMSVFDVESQLSLVNREASNREIEVDARIIEVIEKARMYSSLTCSAFDITIEPLMKLYGFRDDKSVLHFPTDWQIAETLDAVEISNVIINSQLSTINFEQSKTKLDFGGIAVGYAIDRAVSILKRHGIESAIINHSGDIFALGSPPDENGWEVGITDPLQTENIITTVRIKNQALSTSGNYQNFVKAEGKTIGHILDPSNGRTATDMLSSTVIAPTAIEADALSTGFFVLGIEQSRPIIRQSKNIRCIAVLRDGAGKNIVEI